MAPVQSSLCHSPVLVGVTSMPPAQAYRDPTRVNPVAVVTVPVSRSQIFTQPPRFDPSTTLLP